MDESSICPECAGPVEADESVWLVRGRFYCREQCAAAAAARRS